MTTAVTSPKPVHLVAAFLSGGLLTLMLFFNGELARYGNPLFSSWAAHGSGMLVAILAVMLLGKAGPPSVAGPIPLWAYLGGISGAATVAASVYAVNTPLALAGTLELGLVGQVVFSLAADRWGLFGLPARRLGLFDLAAVALISAGSALIILYGKIGT